MKTARRHLLSFGLAGLWFLLGGTIRAQYDPIVEYTYKAGFLYQFALQTTWAQESFADADASFVIGILGTDPWRGELGKKLRGAIKPGGSVKERKLEVRKCNNSAEAAQCHLVFISKSEKARLPQILDDLKNTKVFTVVEADKAAETDGVINLYLDNSIKFILNEEAAERASLKMASELKEAAARRYRKKK